MSPCLRVTRHESELGSWELVTGAPDARLRGYAGDYQGYVEGGSPAPVRQESRSRGSRWS